MAKAALEVALARATQQRSAYEPYREMARFDHQLDLDSLAPAYKATCAAAAKALTGVRSLLNVVAFANSKILLAALQPLPAHPVCVLLAAPGRAASGLHGVLWAVLQWLRYAIGWERKGKEVHVAGV